MLGQILISLKEQVARSERIMKSRMPRHLKTTEDKSSESED